MEKAVIRTFLFILEFLCGVGDHLDLHFHSQRKSCNLEAGTGRLVLGEIFCIDGVHSLEVGYVCEENGGFDHIFIAQTRLRKDCSHVFQSLMTLILNGFSHAPVCRIHRNLT